MRVFSSLLLDLKHAFRRLQKSPGFTTAAILTLSLGMGAATSLFTVAHGVLIRPLPYEDPDRLVALPTTDPEGIANISAPMFWDLQSDAKSLDGAAILRWRGFELNVPGRPEQIPGLEVSAGYFELLGYRPSVGRFFERADENAQQTSVVLSHGLWMRAFGGDPTVVGRSMQLDRRSMVVLGVAPADLELPWNYRAEVFVPLDRNNADTAERLNYNYFAFGRLKAGVTLGTARSEIAAIFRGWLEQYPKTPPEAVLTVEPLQTFLLGSQFRPVALLMAAVCLLLMITCTNVAGLFLARTLGRMQDMALRVALGARQGHLFRQHLCEGLWVGLMGGLCSLPLTGLALKSIRVWLPGAETINGMNRLSVDSRVWVWTFCLGLVVSIFFALMPMIQSRSLDLQQPLKNRNWGGGSRRGWLRTWLVGGQVALTTVLLVSSGLLLRSISKLLGTHPGFETQNLVAFAVRLPTDRYAPEAERTRFQDELLERLRGIPGVEVVGSCHVHPLSGQEGGTSFRLLRAEGGLRDIREGIAADIVSADYFRAMRIPILKGRPILESDRATTPRVVVVNESFARRFLGSDPIGQRISGGWRSDTTPTDTPLEVVGVAADIRNVSLDLPPTPKVMYASAQMPYLGRSFLLRTSHPPGVLRALVEEKVAQQDPQLPILRYGSLQTRAERTVAGRKQTAMLLGTFSAMALLLSGLGIYGVVSYLVSQRTREFGIRKALGAQGVDIVRSVLSEGGRMLLLGGLLGLALTLAAGRLLANQLYGVSQQDPIAVAASILTLGATCLLACLAPAIRATSVDPTVTLRDE